MSKQVTIKQIAQYAGVSEATVSRVLNQPELVSKQTIQKVKDGMDELQYRPSALAQSMRNHTTKTIGVVISNVLNPFFTTLVRGIEDAATKRGYSVIVCNTDENPDKEQRYINMLVDHQADGIILASTGNHANYHSMVNDMPLVFIDRMPQGKDANLYDTVLVDNEKGSFNAVDALIKQGATRVNAIVSPVATTGTERLNGFRKALTTHDFPIREQDIALDDYLGQHTAELALNLIQTNQCDALFCGNNVILMNVLKVLKEWQIGDMKLAVFDDQPWFDFVQYPIISVDQPAYLIGTKAFITLMDRLANPDRPVTHDIVQTKLVIR
ncbi:Ribose operon repressor [Furfurilactobacillus rossiae]|uniref:LacI family DNA-binding transcriptional regulator n=1 Tax=Furfurilactobacillus rossiae TaxID=231049 RepID=UPI0015B85D01|nr:LacI family DNA-binding transcriptional regulator [Furfurilactobacillus rossiae]MCF6165102.1 LacI family transcriptional regulator [Furfurilactobacillus rossiae]QLE62884.1 Ribose operon repressor [Furfurilactobacillus rossiae]